METTNEESIWIGCGGPVGPDIWFEPIKIILKSSHFLTISYSYIEF